MMRLIRCLAACLVTLVACAGSAWGWKPNTHVYLAEQALIDALDDGHVTIHRVDYTSGEIVGVVGNYKVPDETLAALRHTDQFRAGVLGPDAYPDIVTGQQAIHPESALNGGTDSWLRMLWNAALADPGSSSATERAFVMGFFAHCAGDMFGHTLVNQYTGGEFDLTSDNALRHIVLESYIGKRTPVIRSATGSVVTQEDVSIDGVESFIYHRMVKADPGGYLRVNLLAGDGARFSIPAIFSDLREDLVQRYSSASWPEDEYLAHWVEDIDRGLREWPRLSHRIAREVVFNVDGADYGAAKQHASDYVRQHLLSMMGAPDLVGDIAQFKSDLIDALLPQAIQEWLDALKQRLYDYSLQRAFGVGLDEIEGYAKSPELHFDRVLNLEGSGGGSPTSLGEFNARVLGLDDPGYSMPEERFEYHRIPAALNTVTMTKLLFLDRGGLSALASDLGVEVELGHGNIMLGFLRSLDRDNEWSFNDDRMALAGTCAAYEELFAQQVGESGWCVGTHWYVDSSAAGPERGTRLEPLHEVSLGVRAAAPGDTLNVFGGHYGEVPMSFPGQLHVRTVDGRVFVERRR